MIGLVFLLSYPSSTDPTERSRNNDVLPKGVAEQDMYTVSPTRLSPMLGK